MRNVLVLLALTSLRAFAQMPDEPVRSVIDPGVVTTRQSIFPAGVQSVFSGRVQGVAFGANSSEIWVLNSGSLFRMNWRANKVLGRVGLNGVGGLQGVRYDAATRTAYVSAVSKGQVQLARMNGQGQYAIILAGVGKNVAGAVAYSGKSHLAVLPLTGDNKVAVIDTATEQIVYKIDTGMVPFGAAVNDAGTVAYVTNWGGRRPGKTDSTGDMGFGGERDKIVTDARGVASTGTVTRVDLVGGRVEREIPVGLHPTAIVWDEAHSRLYVANGNQDSISVVDTTGDKVMRTIVIEPFPERVGGIAPTALVLSSDGTTLYVACGGINAIAVMRVATGKLAGLIPTAWYPAGLALSPDGKFLAVSTLLGSGSGFAGDRNKRVAHAVRGSIAVIDLPDAAQLANYTLAVAENNRLSIGPSTELPKLTKATSPIAVPMKAGDASLIENVVFIIKENRTYDQILGDMKKGNGDPSLTMYGPDVTPNQHKLADQFVLLDNLYANGGNSADGHQWLTQANETDYVLWPGYTNRSYPFDGTDPVAYSSTGFLWDSALKQNKSVRIFGEFAGTTFDQPGGLRPELLNDWKAGRDMTARWNIVAPIGALNKILVPNYPAYSTTIPDVVRSQIFQAELAKWVKAGSMPNLVMMALPSNHTNGTVPGTSTPKAMVADNDLAVGQIVEALTRSPFWKKMAIFIVEDDAQDGVDHMDGHRTTAFIVSPYIRRGAVDSTFYSQLSILKTIELQLGLPNLTIFDRIANDMRASFQNTPDFTPYQAETPTQSIFAINPPMKALHGQQKKDAVASGKMRFDVPDAAPTGKLNAILWRSEKGESVPYPKARSAVFSPFSLDVGDEDREERKRR